MKSKTHENWIFSALHKKLKRWKRTSMTMLNSVLSIRRALFFSSFCQKTHTQFTLFTNTRPAYYYNVARCERKFWLVLIFSMLVCLRFNIIQSISAILYTSNACPRKVNQKCQKTSTKLNENQQNFVWIFGIFFLRCSIFFRSFSVAFWHCSRECKAIIWEDGNQRNEEREEEKWKEIRRNRLKPKHTANRMLFLVQFWVRLRWT